MTDFEEYLDTVKTKKEKKLVEYWQTLSVDELHEQIEFEEKNKPKTLAGNSRNQNLIQNILGRRINNNELGEIEYKNVSEFQGDKK